MGSFLSSLRKRGQRPLELLKQLVKYYLAFAALHSFYKIVRLVRLMRRAKRLLKDVPGYDQDLAGNGLLKNFNRLHDWRYERLMKYKGADMVKTGGPGIELACISRDAVEFVLKGGFDSVTKLGGGEFYLVTLLDEFIGGDGIFVIRHGNTQPEEHKKWVTQRKSASKIFTLNNFNKMMGKVFLEKSDRMIEVIRSKCSENQEVDMQGMFFSFTMDSIQKIFFNREVDSLETPDPYAKAFDACHDSMMKYLFKNIKMIVASTILLPFPFCPMFESDKYNVLMNIHRLFDKDGQKFKKNRDFLVSETYKFVREARNDPKVKERGDLLANIINAKSDWSDKALKDTILNFIIAGRDTTACMLTWLLYELTQNLDVQEKLTEEIDRVLGGRSPTYNDFNPENMPYLNGVVWETLRLHPPVPEDIKVANEDVVFKDTLIPKGTRLSFIPYTMNRNPDTYPDPLKFNPDRWIPFVKPNEYEFPVFQAGPRFCLGKDMAVFEGKTLLCKLMQNFSFKFNGDSSKIGYSNMITMSLVCDADGTKEDNRLMIQATCR